MHSQIRWQSCTRSAKNRTGGRLAANQSLAEPGSAEARGAVFTKNPTSCRFFLANAVCWCCGSHPANQSLAEPGSAEARGAFGFFALPGTALPQRVKAKKPLRRDFCRPGGASPLLAPQKGPVLSARPAQPEPWREPHAVLPAASYAHYDQRFVPPFLWSRFPP